MGYIFCLKRMKLHIFMVLQSCSLDVDYVLFFLSFTSMIYPAVGFENVCHWKGRGLSSVGDEDFILMKLLCCWGLQSFEALNQRAVAVVVDPIQSVKGKVVIDAFRLINPQTMMLGQEPRQTTSNLGHLNKPSIQVGPLLIVLRNKWSLLVVDIIDFCWV